MTPKDAVREWLRERGVHVNHGSTSYEHESAYKIGDGAGDIRTFILCSTSIELNGIHPGARGSITVEYSEPRLFDILTDYLTRPMI